MGPDRRERLLDCAALPGTNLGWEEQRVASGPLSYLGLDRLQSDSACGGNAVITVGTALWKTLADQTPDPPIVAYAQRLVTVTDAAFTATGAALITVSPGLPSPQTWGGVA